MTEEKLAPEEISRRIVVGMGLVYDLYNELVGFLRMIRESLENLDLDVSSIMGSSFHLPVGPRKSRTAADRYMSVDMGTVFELGAAGNEEEDEEAEDEGSEKEIQKKGLHITGDSQFLAIRVLLYDRNSPDPAVFQPHVFAVLLDKITFKAKSGKEFGAASQEFTVGRNRFLNLVKGIDGGTTKGQTLSCRVTKGQVAVTVNGIVARPLAGFTSESEVQAFIDQVAQLADEQ